MSPDIWSLYALMLKCRLFEEAIAHLWHEGLISGEMHLGTGEEAIVTGIVAHVREGDALALDHRASAALLLRGVDPVLLLREMLGFPDGLCGGMGGHMHLFSKDHLAASSGIVGAAGPAATGFALAGQYLRPRSVAIAFFGDGAMNQGMLLESMNLAAVWSLPVLFVCKDDGWAITTPSRHVTAGHLGERVRGFGLPYAEVDGRDVAAVWEAAAGAIESARSGRGPTFLHARCVHLEGHFLGFQLTRAVRAPLREMPGIALPLTRSLLQPGGGDVRERLAGLRIVLTAILATLRDPRRDATHDPVRRTRGTLSAETERLRALEELVETEVNQILASALDAVPS